MTSHALVAREVQAGYSRRAARRVRVDVRRDNASRIAMWVCAVALVGAAAAVLLVPAGPVLRDGVAPEPAVAGAGLASLPLAARGPISAALGRDSAGYWVARWHARNPAQEFSAGFTRSGVTVLARGRRIGLRLVGLGRGRLLRAVASAMPVAQANRVVYQRGGLREWWANGPLGLEQGFVVPARPAGGQGPLTLAVAVSGGGRVRLQDGSVSIGSLRYGDLVATDGRGRTLPARLALRAGRIVVAVNDRNAQYPVRIDPLVLQAVLASSDQATSEDLGWSVAVSGTMVAVGADEVDIDQHEDQGAVFVFEEPNTGWASAGGTTVVNQVAELVSSDGAAGDYLGSSVAISGDTIVAGSKSHRNNGNVPAGAAYVWVEPNTGWQDSTLTESISELTSSDTTNDAAFGTSVAISGDTVVVGAPGETVGGSAQGAAYVFEPGATWPTTMQPTAELTASDGAAADGLGMSVAVEVPSTGATTFVAGAPSHEVGSNDTGSAYVFVEPSTGWPSMGTVSQIAELTDSDGPDTRSLGWSVAISGGTIVAGDPEFVVNGNFAGAVDLYTEPGTGWANAGGATLTQDARLVAGDPADYNYVGASVAISGSTVLAGLNLGGAALLFTEPSPGGWSGTVNETQDLGTSSGTATGQSVAAADGLVYIGSPENGGSVGVYGSSPPTVTIVTPPDGASYTQGQSVAASYVRRGWNGNDLLVRRPGGRRRRHRHEHARHADVHRSGDRFEWRGDVGVDHLQRGRTAERRDHQPCQ